MISTARSKEVAGPTIDISPSAILAFLALSGAAMISLLDAAGALLFLGAGITMVLLRPAQVLTVLRREWLFVVLSGWCLLTVLWSDYPAITLRYGIQLAVTLTVALVMAYRLTPGGFLKVAGSAYLVAGILSLVIGQDRPDGQGYLGIFGSKNALAGASSIMVLAGVSLLLDRRMPLPWRVIGAVLLACGTVLVAMAQSVGAVLTLAVVGVACVVLLGLRRLPPLPRLIVSALALMATALVVLVAVSHADALARNFADATGKDLTLTGRTGLWAVALHEIARNPLGGAGYQAVWVPGNPVAELLWAEFGIIGRSGFNFHNALLSNAVEIGVVGAAIQAVLLLGAVPALVAWALRDRSAGVLFLLLLLLRQLVLMNVEVTFFSQFHDGSILTAALIAYAHRWRREQPDTAAAR